MPLPNTAETEWTGYLVEGLNGRSEALLTAVGAEIVAREMPGVTAQTATINMWWRDSSPCLDVRSKLDGEVACTIHAMDYGKALFIGIAFAPLSKLGNYYKRMAAVAFLESIDRCIDRAIRLAAHDGAAAEITTLGKVGKFGA